MKIKRHQLRKILHEVLNTDLRDEIALSASLGAEGAEQNDLLNEMSLLRLLEVDIDGSGDLSPDELRDLADDLEGEPLTGQELRDALISNISDMHKDIYRKHQRLTRTGGMRSATEKIKICGLQMKMQRSRHLWIPKKARMSLSR